ncbi:MAG: hypothetical protein AAF736_16100, partial [Pseudomonadota bacterium]
MSTPGSCAARYTPLVLVVGLCTAAYPNESAAQNSPLTNVSDERLEEVVVTGSRIRRRDFTSPSPIASIDSSFLEFTGQ